MRDDDDVSDDTSDDDYAVGYGKPPRHTQFKKGQSGNARGRPPQSLNLTTLVQSGLAETVVVNQNGRRKTISKGQAMVTQQVNKAASGDLRAFEALKPFFPVAITDAVSENSFDSVVDKQVATEFMKRMQNQLLPKKITNNTDEKQNAKKIKEIKLPENTPQKSHTPSNEENTS